MRIPVYNRILSTSQSNIAGAIRFNDTTVTLEMYDGTNWRSILPDPKTWQEWFQHFCNAIIDFAPGERDQYVLRKMQENFPGNYTVKSSNDSNGAGGPWMEFNTPADETWFHLKYD